MDLNPKDIPRIKKLVTEHGDEHDEQALARIVLTLFKVKMTKTKTDQTENEEAV